MERFDGAVFEAGVVKLHADAELGEGARRYRKRPVVIEAVRMELPFAVETLEGLMRGKAGDYLLRGVAGELYPCDAEIFDATYDLVTED